MLKHANFLQGNGETHTVTIDSNSKKKFGSFGYMYIVTFTENNTSHYMTREQIKNATGIDTSKRNWQYK